MFFDFINNDVSKSPQFCWEIECLVYGFIVAECYSITIKPFESFYDEVIRFADKLSFENKNIAYSFKNDIDWKNVFNNYLIFMEKRNDISPEYYFCCDKDKVKKFMKRN